MIPMEAVLPAAAAGALIGLAVRAAWPAKPDLASVLDRLDARHTTAALPTAAPAGPRTLPERLGTRLLGEFGVRISLPTKDLSLLRISPAEHLGKRVLFTLYGLLAPQLLQALLVVAGTPLPFTLPAVCSLALGVLFWLAPGRDVKRAAAAARLIVRHAAASYLERVALARIANSGAAQALTQTAEVGDGWIFARMRQVFSQAELSGVTPWDALKQLGEELDIPELTRPADTLALAGDGAAVYATLQAQARQLRIALLSDSKAEANAASASMVLPVTFGVILMLTFVMIPVTSTILSS
ncbi:type II secretion system F family protein [Streptomyces violaceusniger]|uniref:Type II secretion system F domain-containing protein n=1 Tax=Streptomyces violaceusniger (strain Tu 4113) TaxID=653045 RepID=G2PH61_STRV4|nr:type II secretion system F family protein [Streptomyces violaceusniger]AEM88707.1 Type II secretion system F domain-containing protein [Streptomyces violaceusniger Tu 4113]